MFDIDLLNSSGLQKIISRQKVSDTSAKGSIVFSTSEVKEDIEGQSYSEDIDTGGDGLLSYVATVVLLISLVIFAFLDYQKIFSINTSNELIISSLIRVVNEPNTKSMINSIVIDKEVELSFSVDNLDRVKQLKSVLKEDSYQYRVYESEDNYIIEASNTVASSKKSHDEITSLLNSIVDKYNSETTINVYRDIRYIKFISDNKTIFSILEEIINFGAIKISPHDDIVADFIALEFYH